MGASSLGAGTHPHRRSSRERAFAVFDGKPADRFPVTSIYSFFYLYDHFAELTGLPQWRLDEWLSMPPDQHIQLFRQVQAFVPFELVQPSGICRTREWRERQEFVVRDGRPFRHDRKTDDWVPLGTGRSGHALEFRANQERHIYTREDVHARVAVVKAEEIVERGSLDYQRVVVDEYGRDHFVISGGVVGAFYACTDYVGIGNLFPMLREEADLIHYLSARILERTIEEIRAIASVGGDAIYIDESLATSDVISPADYERFAMPYVAAMVGEIHRLGLKAIVLYWGGVADRLDQIASTGADCLVMEASMRGFVNDIEDTVRRVGKKMTLCPNIDPYSVIEKGTDEELDAEIRRQVEAGRKARGFVITNASQLTPRTPLARVQRFLELGRSIGKQELVGPASR